MSVGAYTIIKVEEMLELNEKRREINKHEIDEIMLVNEDGHQILISEEFIERWKFCGLNITDLEDLLVNEDGSLVTEINSNSWKTKM